MAVSRSMLESLLARVRRRANEPRPPSLVIPPLSIPRIDVAPVAFGQAVGADDEVEEYGDELIEIIDDDDVASYSGSTARPLDLSVSAPSVEVRRRIIAPNLGSDDTLTPGSATPVAPAAPAARSQATRSPPVASIPSPEPLRAEVVSRKPVAAAEVIQSRGARRDLRAVPFVELLDASLKLGG
jgi:hypothetical protein